MIEECVIVGGGPVGLWTAIQIKKREPKCKIHVYERYEQYKRSHILKLEHFSALLYSEKRNDKLEEEFYQKILDAQPSMLKEMSLSSTPFSSNIFIKTNELEGALTDYATKLGIEIHKKKEIASTADAEKLHPDCNIFIAADGSHSKIREDLFGKESLSTNHALQYIVEFKYEVQGKTSYLSKLNDYYKSIKAMNFMVFEHIGKEKQGTTPVTLRFFVDKDTYNKFNGGSFKNPTKFDENSNEIPEKLKNDINFYLNVRKHEAKEDIKKDTGKLTKTILSNYCAREFSKVKDNGKAWFLAGDAAMGIPYFRALNSGFILSSILAEYVAKWSPAYASKYYNRYSSLRVFVEFSMAYIKNTAINIFDLFRKVSNLVPWQIIKWNEEKIKKFHDKFTESIEAELSDSPQLPAQGQTEEVATAPITGSKKHHPLVAMSAEEPNPFSSGPGL